MKNLMRNSIDIAARNTVMKNLMRNSIDIATRNTVMENSIDTATRNTVMKNLMRKETTKKKPVYLHEVGDSLDHCDEELDKKKTTRTKRFYLHEVGDGYASIILCGCMSACGTVMMNLTRKKTTNMKPFYLHKFGDGLGQKHFLRLYVCVKYSDKELDEKGKR